MISGTSQPARAVTAREGVGSFACLRLPRRFLIDASADPSGGFEQQLHSRVPAAEPGAGTHIVHRIVGGSAGTGFLVKGDSREHADYSRPRTEEIVGKMRLSVPSVGSVLVFLRTPAGIALIAGLTTLLIALGVSAGPSRKTGETS